MDPQPTPQKHSIHLQPHRTNTMQVEHPTGADNVSTYSDESFGSFAWDMPLRLRGGRSGFAGIFCCFSSTASEDSQTVIERERDQTMTRRERRNPRLGTATVTLRTSTPSFGASHPASLNESYPMQNARPSPPSLRVQIPGRDGEKAGQSVGKKDGKPLSPLDTKGKANADENPQTDTTAIKDQDSAIDAETEEPEVSLVASVGQTTPKNYRGRPRYPADDDEFEPVDDTA